MSKFGLHVQDQIHEKIKYLEIYLPKETKDLYIENYKTLVGEGNGTPLQYSFLENPRDGGAWWAAVYGVTQSQTRLK